MGDDDGDDRGTLGRGHQRGGGKRLIGAAARIVPVEAQHFFGLGHRVEHHPGQHRTHRVNPILERGDDTKIAAAAAQAPEELGVLVWADG